MLTSGIVVNFDKAIEEKRAGKVREWLSSLVSTCNTNSEASCNQRLDAVASFCVCETILRVFVSTCLSLAIVNVPHVFPKENLLAFNDIHTYTRCQFSSRGTNTFYSPRLSDIIRPRTIQNVALCTTYMNLLS